jgi:ribosomal protein S12
VEAARQSRLPKAVKKIIDEAPRYPEGTGVRLEITARKDLAAIRKLAEVKLAN